MNTCAVITGAGSGIGRAIAERMAADGPVVLVSRSRAPLEETSSLLRERPHRIIVGDVRDPQVAASALHAVTEAGWSVRHLISNAGIGKSGALETYSPELWREIMEVNVDGAFHFVQACLPDMLSAKQGTIVLMSSISGVRGSSHNAAYVTSKHALVGFAAAIAHEYGKRGIVATAVCPGFVESAMTDRSIAGYAKRHGVGLEEARSTIAKTNPQRRIIPAKEVAEMVAFICAGHVPSLSGNPLVLSGGV